MNRKTITGIILAISVLLNIVLLVFASVQKTEADSALEKVFQNEKVYLEQSRIAKTELDICEAMRVQSDEAREECEQRVLSLSNRKH